jgi:chloramphenicol 3-O phosphotransferase
VSDLETVRGRIIFLNGVSSSGKTAIAKELLLLLDSPHFHMAVDDFNRMRSRERTLAVTPSELDEVLRRTRAGFHRAAVGMAEAGNDLVIDHVLSEAWRLRDCLKLMAGLEVVFVGVRCSPDELERREQARGDRVSGQSADQLERVHTHGIYDLECDTTTATAHACALQVKAFLDSGVRPTAFDILRRNPLWIRGNGVDSVGDHR